MKPLCLLISSAYLFPSFSALAADLRVPEEHATIQAAIDAASNGDRIVVGPGTYGNDISFDGKDIEVVSSAGAELTVIDLSRMSTFEMGPDGALVGFAIRNGRTPDGGGLEVRGNDSYITENIFEDNWMTGTARAASISILQGSPVIERNIFRRCRSTTTYYRMNSVISVFRSGALVANNLFHDNSIPAIKTWQIIPGMLPVVVNNTMVRNQIGILIEFPRPDTETIFRNNLISDNQTGLQVLGPTANTWENNLVYGNDSNYVGVPDQTGINGNLSADPRFIDSANNDFTLLEGSPAIDAGTNMSAPLFDFAGNPRPTDGDGDTVALTDIGAYETVDSVGIVLVIDGGLEHECNTTGGALVGVTARTVPEHLELDSLAFSIDGVEVADSSPSEVILPLGVSEVTVHGVTLDGTEVMDSKHVQVRDTTPPVLDAWFEDRRTGRKVETIESRMFNRLVIRIDAQDICDPDPEADAVLGTPVAAGQELKYQGARQTLSLETDQLTLSVTARDASGNTSSMTTELEVEISRPSWKNVTGPFPPRSGRFFFRR